MRGGTQIELHNPVDMPDVMKIGGVSVPGVPGLAGHSDGDAVCHAVTDAVLEEIATVEDTPDDLVFELHNEALWGQHPYGYSILGTRETVSSMGVAVRGYSDIALSLATSSVRLCTPSLSWKKPWKSR